MPSSSPVTPVPAAPRWTLLPLPHGRPAEPLARDWLAGQLDTDPAALPLRRDARGRPRLNGHAGLDCNWSHSGDCLLVALGRRMQLGIDLERQHSRPRALELARRFFRTEEANWLAAQAADGRDRAFLRLWCAKEAVLKAHGHGLSFGLERLWLGERDGALRLLECDPALGRPREWNVLELQPAPGYLGALAWRGLDG